MKKVLFIYPRIATFITSDVKILSKHFHVTESTADWASKIKLPFLLLQQFFSLLFRIHSFDFILTSFGGYWSLLPSLLGSLLGKPVYIILHGTDCVSFKEINYGSLRKSYLKKIIGTSYKYATKLLPVSKSLLYTENTYFSDKIIKQGVQYFFPEIKTPTEVIPNVFDTNEWSIKPEITRKENRFVTVMGQGQFYLKGGEMILEVAKKFPQNDFYFIGLTAPKHVKEIPENVRFLGRVEPNVLVDYFNESSYYFQLSISEGFGCALCEAMLCGCVPIVSSVNILPDIIGDTGYVLDTMDTDKLETLLRNLNKNTQDVTSRNQIIKNYSIKVRENGFLKTFT